ncbi:PAS factor family protein [Vibrio taketomensis]|uniref:PAS factor family protein n=1 Tax=Vibrio taketomensis TaxID=2572923 RepID=UPI0013898FFF|nr:PAS factor family protein [Vibrio taketomensis]
MKSTTTLIHDTLLDLTTHAPQHHAAIRQSLYDQLDLPFEKQLVLYSCALAPASSGKLEGSQDINRAVDSVMKLLEMPER